MPKYDNIATPLTPFIGLDQQAFTTTTNGVTIPLAGLVSLAWIFFCNAYTSGTMTFKIQVSPDDSNWYDLDEKYVIRPATASITADNQLKKIGMSGVTDPTYKYARLVTLGTVVLSGCALAIGLPDER